MDDFQTIPKQEAVPIQPSNPMNDEFIRQLAENMEKLISQSNEQESEQLDESIKTLHDLQAAFTNMPQELKSKEFDSFKAEPIKESKEFQSHVLSTMDKLRDSSSKVEVICFKSVETI